MGIFGALNTAVGGLQAQSFALENVSGNIANSQTTAFKRIDTSFEDLIPDLPPSQQKAGSVEAMARSTNNVQGDIKSSSVGTFLAINGDGFFVVQKPTSVIDSVPVFSGIDTYTRRGDFQPDKNGFLVNGAGNFLMGIPVDPTTGNLVGSVPQVLKFQNDFLPAQPTSTINYRANLPSYPFTAKHDTKVLGSELINPADFIANPLAVPPAAAKIVGTGAALLADAPAVVTGSLALPNSLVTTATVTINGQAVNLTAGMNQVAVRNAINAAAPPGVTASLTAGNALVLTSTNATTAITVASGSIPLLTELGISAATTQPTNLLSQSAVAQGDTMTVKIGANAPVTITFGNLAGQVQTLAQLNGATGLGGLNGGTGSVVPSGAGTGDVTITASSPSDNITVTGTVNPKTFGMQVTSAIPSNQTVIANDVDTFISESVGGGAITAFDVSGSPVNLQMRWAKVSTSLQGQPDVWNLFYQVNSNATGTQTAWQNVGTNYTFGANGQMNPLVANVTLNNVTVNGVALGTVQINHGSGGITQFADPNGTVQVNQLDQNGFPAGSLQTVSVNDKGRVVGSYSNGRTIDLAQVTLAKFNGPNFLQRLDGGAFAVTDESGPAILGAAGKIASGSLEASNVDIADEFTKLIVTQQAYSANTKVITTANQMTQDLLNMLR
ncbi:MAG: flagellar hook-basal body complex protein [Xanthobacteraceae bacterium]